MVQLVEALRYKPGGRGFDIRWRLWHSPLMQSCRLLFGPGSTEPVTEMSKGNGKVEFPVTSPLWPRGWVEI